MNESWQRWYKRNLPLSEEVQELNLTLDLMDEGVEAALYELTGMREVNHAESA